MPEGVSEIEDAAQVAFAFVELDDPAFRLQARSHVGAQRRVAETPRGDVGADPGERPRRVDDRELDDLAVARPHVILRERVDEPLTHQDALRRRKRADLVLERTEIHAALRTDAAVRHGEQRGRNVNVRNAPIPQVSAQRCYVLGDTSADRHDRRAFVAARRLQREQGALDPL